MFNNYHYDNNYDDTYDNIDQHKLRGKTRQNLKSKDKKKKQAQEYLKETQYKIATAAYKKANNGYDNALQANSKTGQKLTKTNKTAKPVKTRKTLIDKPKSVNKSNYKRDRTDSPPPKCKRNRRGKNKGKPSACSFCRPEIGKRMDLMVTNQREIKMEVDQFEMDKVEMDTFNPDVDDNGSINFYDFKDDMFCICGTVKTPRTIDEMNDMIIRKETEFYLSSKEESEDSFLSACNGDQEDIDQELSNEGEDKKGDEEEDNDDDADGDLSDYFKIDIDDNVESIDKGWQLI